MFARILLCATAALCLSTAAASAQPAPVAPAPTPRLFSGQGVKYAEGFEGQYRQVFELVARRYADMESVKKLKPYQGKISTADERDARIKELVEVVGERWLKFRSSTDLSDAQARFEVGLLSPGLLLDRTKDGYIVSVAWARGAAEKAGLRPGDRIVSVGGIPLDLEWNQSQLDWSISNFSGVEVTVEFVKRGEKEISSVQLTYSVADSTVVDVKMLPGRVLYVQVTTFMNFNLLNDFARQVSAAVRGSEGEVAGIVLDLRGNTGGYMDLAFEFAAAFIGEGEIARTVSRDGRVLHTTVHSALPYLPELLEQSAANVKLVNALQTAPMVVLTNGSTMSAAEMLTSALKDNKRATILGEQTWGKAVSFHTLRIAGGELQLVTGRFAGPSGYDHNHNGIVPHQVVVQPRDGQDVQLAAALVALKTTPVQPFNRQNVRSGAQQLLRYVPLVGGALLLAVVAGVLAHRLSRGGKRVRRDAEPVPDFSWMNVGEGVSVVDLEVADDAERPHTDNVPPAPTLRESSEGGLASLLEPDEAHVRTGEVYTSILAPDSFYIGTPCQLCGARFAAGDDINHHSTTGGCTTYCNVCIEKV